MNSLRCAIIGTGRIGSLLERDLRREKPATHAGAIADNPECLLAAGADIDRDRLKEFGEDWNLSPEHLYTEAESMLQSESIDILHICSETEGHIPLLRLAVQHRVPVVVLEKPISHTVEEALEGEKILAAGATRVVVNHERRFCLDYNHVKKVVEDLRYGQICSVRTRLFMGRRRGLKDVITHDGTHLFDILRYLFGELKLLQTGGNINRDEMDRHEIDPQDIDEESGGCETLSLWLEGERVPAIEMEFGRGRDYLLFELDLSFERGRIVVGNGEYHEFESIDSPFYENFRSLSRKDIEFQETGYFRHMMAHAVELAKNPLQESLSSFDDGLATLRVIESVTRGGEAKEVSQETLQEQLRRR